MNHIELLYTNLHITCRRCRRLPPMSARGSPLRLRPALCNTTLTMSPQPSKHDPRPYGPKRPRVLGEEERLVQALSASLSYVHEQLGLARLPEAWLPWFGFRFGFRCSGFLSSGTGSAFVALSRSISRLLAPSLPNVQPQRSQIT